MPSARVDSPKDAKDDADRAAVLMGLIRVRIAYLQRPGPTELQDDTALSARRSR